MRRHPRRITVRSLLSAACLATVSITCLATVLVATGGSSGAIAKHSSTVAVSAAKTPVKVVFINPVPGTPDWDRGAAYVVNDAKKYGYSVTVAAGGPVGALDIPTEITEIQEAIADHAQVIMTCVCSSGAYTHVFSLAHKAGILVVGLAAPPEVPPGARLGISRLRELSPGHARDLNGAGIGCKGVASDSWSFGASGPQLSAAVLSCVSRIILLSSKVTVLSAISAPLPSILVAEFPQTRV